MVDYRLTATDTVIRIADGVSVPDDPGNRDRIAYDQWLEADGVPEPYLVPPGSQTVTAQDLIAQLSPADAALIKAAVAANNQFWLLWSALQAQADPMIVTNARFQQGWTALTQVLGSSRMSEIATALGASELAV